MWEELCCIVGDMKADILAFIAILQQKEGEWIIYCDLPIQEGDVQLDLF